ncbi:thermonuclease family protein [Sphingorhabdus sp. Alg239-R122]|uniref:thermonuclease family protein n=1 Tax=Sphingorhabdus sp. Alg239-R122 TaxID=2305989 RepID=UPI0013D9D473|nr:thermonuclease family protein [Sphingorhabdus sp. Alg239-R122]
MTRNFIRTLLFFGLLIGVYFAIDYLPIGGDPEENSLEPKGTAVRAIDGDSFRMGEDELRLTGMDAPEYRQTCHDASGGSWDCGKTARGALAALLREDGLSCTLSARDNFGRGIATCSTDRTYDIAQTMVHRGMAVASGGNFAGGLVTPTYADAEQKAKNAKRGIWQGEFTMPREWRDSNPHKLTGAADAP